MRILMIREIPPFDCVSDMVGYQPQDRPSVVRAFRGRTSHLVFCSTVDVYRKPAGRYLVTEDEPHGSLNSSNRLVSAWQRLGRSLVQDLASSGGVE
jgi:hypothetical protein